MSAHLIPSESVCDLIRDNAVEYKPPKREKEGAYYIIVFMDDDDKNGYKIQDVKRTRESKIYNLLKNYKHKYFSLIKCKGMIHQESLFVSILNTFPIKYNISQTNNLLWRTHTYIKRTYNIKKVQMNRERENNNDICFEYNNVEYWYVPHFEKVFGSTK